MRLLDEKRNVPKELVTSEAEKVARSFVVKKDKREKKITSHQLRRFYNEFKTLERKLAHKTSDQQIGEEDAFQQILPLVMLNIPKVKYVASRGLVPREFQKWLELCLNKIKDVEAFRAFLLHFEAVVGFCYGFGLKD